MYIDLYDHWLYKMGNVYMSDTCGGTSFKQLPICLMILSEGTACIAKSWDLTLVIIEYLFM